MKISICFFKISILLFALCNYNLLHAEYPSDTTSYSNLVEFVTNISDLNGDKVQDTLMSYIRITGHSFPTSIHWGKLEADSIIKIGILKYPNWSQVDARITVDDYDLDTTSDMIFYLWGKINQDSLNKIDTGKVILLWGQKGLDSLETINLDSLLVPDNNQFAQKSNASANYFNSDANSKIESNKIEIQELKIGKEIFNPVSILNSPGTSFEVRIPPRKKIRHKEEEVKKSFEDNQWGVNIYPNPNEGKINLSTEALPIGLYTITVFDNSGKQVLQDNLQINNIGKNILVIDMTTSVNGIYHLVIHSNKTIYGTYKFIVNK